MKHLTALSICALSLALFAEDAPSAINATATLKDGSTVRGAFLSERITGSTAFADTLPLSPDIVKSVSFTGTNGEAKVALTNGDTFAMTVADDKFILKSLIGDLTIPRASFRSLAFSRATSGGECGLVFHCTFDDRASIATPAAGPNGIFQSGSFTAGKNGGALRVPAFTSCAKFSIPEGMIGPAGTIEFWAKVNDFGPLTEGGCPRFFEILAPGGRGEISHDWNSNNGSGGSGLTFRIDGLHAMASSTQFSYSGIFGSEYPRPVMAPTSGWHHYALVWDVKGVGSPQGPSAVVYLDGRRALCAPFAPEWKGPVNLSGGATLLFPSREDEMPGYARRSYDIDDFNIWNSAKTSFDL